MRKDRTSLRGISEELNKITEDANQAREAIDKVKESITVKQLVVFDKSLRDSHELTKQYIQKNLERMESIYNSLSKGLKDGRTLSTKSINEFNTLTLAIYGEKYLNYKDPDVERRAKYQKLYGILSKNTEDFDVRSSQNSHKKARSTIQQLAAYEVDKLTGAILNNLKNKYHMVSGELDVDKYDLFSSSHHKRENLRKLTHHAYQELWDDYNKSNARDLLPSDVVNAAEKFAKYLHTFKPNVLTATADKVYEAAVIVKEGQELLEKNIRIDGTNGSGSAGAPAGWSSKGNYLHMHSHPKRSGVDSLRPSLSPYGTDDRNSVDITSMFASKEKYALILHGGKYFIIDNSKVDFEKYNNETKEGKQIIDSLSMAYAQALTLVSGNINKQTSNKNITRPKYSHEFKMTSEQQNIIAEITRRIISEILGAIGSKVYTADLDENYKMTSLYTVPGLSNNWKNLLHDTQIGINKYLENFTNKNLISNISEDFLANTISASEAFIQIGKNVSKTGKAFERPVAKAKELYNYVEDTKEELELMDKYLRRSHPDNSKGYPTDARHSYMIPSAWVTEMSKLYELQDVVFKLGPNKELGYSLAIVEKKAKDIFLSWCIQAMGGSENVENDYQRILSEQNSLFINFTDTTQTNNELSKTDDIVEELVNDTNMLTTAINNTVAGFKEKAAYIYFYLRQIEEIWTTIEESGSDDPYPWLNEILNNPNMQKLLSYMSSINETDLVFWNAYNQSDENGIADYFLGLTDIFKTIENIKNTMLELSRAENDCSEELSRYDMLLRQEISKMIDYAESAISGFESPLKTLIETIIAAARELMSYFFNPWESTDNHFIENMIKYGESVEDVLTKIRESTGYYIDDGDSYQLAEVLTKDVEELEATTEKLIEADIELFEIEEKANTKLQESTTMALEYKELQESIADAVHNASIEQENYADALPTAYRAGTAALTVYKSEASAIWSLLCKMLVDNIEKLVELRNAEKNLGQNNGAIALIEDHHRLGEEISDNEVIVNRFAQAMRDLSDNIFNESLVNPIQQFTNSWRELPETVIKVSSSVSEVIENCRLLPAIMQEVAEETESAAHSYQKFERVEGEFVDDWRNRSPFFDVKNAKFDNDEKRSKSRKKTKKSEDDLNASTKETAESLAKEGQEATETAQAMLLLEDKKKKTKRAEKDVKQETQAATEAFEEEARQVGVASDRYSDLERAIRRANNILNTDNGRYINRYRNELQSALNTVNEIFNQRAGNAQIIPPENMDAVRNFIAILNRAGNKENLTGTYMNLQAYQIKISDFLQKNSNASTLLKNQFRDLNNEISRVIASENATADQINNIKRQWLTLSYVANNYGQLGKSFFDSLSKSITQANLNFIRMYFSWYDWIRYIRYAVTTVIELDTALVDLKKTTTMTNSQLESFYYDANDLAKELGVTTKEIIEQAAAWSRLGYSSQEAATTMARISSQFAAISPGMDTDTATSGLISIMKAFDIDVVDAERKVLDNINTIGNNFGTSNDQIVTGLEKSSAAMKAAGNSLEETIAIFTSAQEIMQDADTVGKVLPIFTVM